MQLNGGSGVCSLGFQPWFCALVAPDGCIKITKICETTLERVGHQHLGTHRVTHHRKCTVVSSCSVERQAKGQGSLQLCIHQ